MVASPIQLSINGLGEPQGCLTSHPYGEPVYMAAYHIGIGRTGPPIAMCQMVITICAASPVKRIAMRMAAIMSWVIYISWLLPPPVRRGMGHHSTSIFVQ